MTSTTTSSTGWGAYWSECEVNQRFWRKTTEHYAANLIKLISFRSGDSVLDYGSGPGFLAEHLADSVEQLVLVEPSERLLAISRAHNAGRENVRHVLLRSRDDLSAVVQQHAFDVILLNSVIQYIPQWEVSPLFNLFQRALKPAGQILVTDIVLEGSFLIREALATLYYYSKWFGTASFMKYLFENRASVRSRTQNKLSQYTIASFEAMVGTGFDIRWVNNPTFCSNRMCVLLTHGSSGVHTPPPRP